MLVSLNALRSASRKNRGITRDLLHTHIFFDTSTLFRGNIYNIMKQEKQLKINGISLYRKFIFIHSLCNYYESLRIGKEICLFVIENARVEMEMTLLVMSPKQR